MSEVLTFEKEVAGRKLTIETGKMALQTNASLTLRYGDTVILATAVMSKDQREGLDFFPLMVEYEERLYAAGKIKGSRFIKREGRPTDEAIINARMIDRAIRPLFDEQIRNEVQVVITVLSFDDQNDPAVLGLVAASAVLTLSDIPWNGPIAGVRVGRLEDKFIVNPGREDLETSDINLIIAGTPDKTIMLEAGAKEIEEKTMFEAMMFGKESFKDIIALIEEAKTKVGKEKRDILDLLPDETEESLKQKQELKKQVQEFIKPIFEEYLLNRETPTKALRKTSIDEIKAKLKEHLENQELEDDLVDYALGLTYKLVEAEVSQAIITKEQRVDGRKLTQIRELSSEVSLLPRTHGSGLFNRGQTQVLSCVTLGSPGEVQLLDTLEESAQKRYMHHYNFPPYSVSEARPMRGVGRRDIGHGALAEKALLPVLPAKEDFPYTIRVVSETLGSNGSSSMASVCGSTLALMDGGVPITKPVAGIAMGLASDDQGNYKVLTDIQDLEDADGGMDFKVAGTKDGITAIQLDTKTTGLSDQIVEQTLNQAKEARLEILKVITDTIPAPRPDLSPYAPRITSFNINPDKIRDVIGPGGKMINQIIDETGVNIDIEDDGLVMVTSTDQAMSEKAIEWIKSLTEEAEVGKIYDGKVNRIMDFGAFVEILPNQDGMVHISKMAPFRIDRVTDVLNIGDQVKVKVDEIDEMGRINLSLVEGGKTPQRSAPRTGPRRQGPNRFGQNDKKDFRKRY